MRRQRLELYELPDYIPRKNKSNDYGFDPHEQEHETFTGMGADINVHDQWACESMGAIQDRTKEHLGQSDKAISAYRRLLRGAIEQAGQRRAAADGARCRCRRQAHRPGRHRRHRSDRRLADLLAENRRMRGARRRAGRTAADVHAEPSRRIDRGRGRRRFSGLRRPAAAQSLSRRRAHSRDRAVRAAGPVDILARIIVDRAGQAARAKRHRGESRRRRRQHRHGRRRACQARRLYAPAHARACWW